MIEKELSKEHLMAHGFPLLRTLEESAHESNLQGVQLPIRRKEIGLRSLGQTTRKINICFFVKMAGGWC